MNTPNESRPLRANFWLRAIEFRKDELTRDYRKTLGDTAREGISDEDYATTMATLEKMARNLGWDESQRHERGVGRRGFGPGFGRGHRHPAMMHHGFEPHHPSRDDTSEA
jgi:hypothetical protein